MDASEVVKTTVVSLTHVGLMVVGAIILLIIGRWLIAFGVRLITRALERQRVDPTLLRYVGNIVSVILNVALVVAILGYFGVETTTFAALLAAAEFPVPEQHFVLRTADAIAKGEASLPEIGVRPHAA